MIPTVDADANPPSDHVDVVLTDDESGMVVVLVVARTPRRVRVQRLMVFLADGVTLWFDSQAGADDHLPDLSWERSGRAERVRLFAHTREDLEPAEHLLGPGAPPARVPVTLDLSLAPLSLPVPRHRRFADGGLTGAQVFRAEAALAAGSEIYRIRGQAWVSGTGFSSTGTRDGVRLQAAFQDGSSLLAVAPESAGVAGPAALQEHTATTVTAVASLRVQGPDRRIPVRLLCQLEREERDTIIGGYRSLDQHIAFVAPDDDGSWVRRAYTPFDVSRSGVTGFGVLEQVTTVSSPDGPAVVGTGIPETF